MAPTGVAEGIASSAERGAAAARSAMRRLVPNEDTRFLLLTALAGLLGGLAAAGVGWVIHFVQRALLGAPPPGADLLEAARALPWWRLALAPALAALAGGFATLLAARFAGGGGVAVIMESVSIRRGVVGMPAALLRALGSSVTIAGGGSVGREGPTIALGAAAASFIGRTARLGDDRLRVLVAAGTAGGFAAAYNTPVAGTLFVLEVIVGSFAVEVLGPTALAAVVGALVARSLSDAPPIYAVGADYGLHSPYEIPAFVLLGLGAAAGGALLLESLRYAERLFSRIPSPAPLRAAIGGLAVGAIAAAGLPEVLGNGHETTQRLIGGRYPVDGLALLFGLKIVATAATVGSGSPGGVFTPTLLLGAALGSALGHGVGALFPGASPEVVYVLVGMGALLAATTHAPLVSVVFVFEATRDYGILLPLLLSSVIASIASRRLRARSVYEEELARRGLSWEGSAEERALRAIRVRDVMRGGIPLLPRTLPISEVVRAFLTTKIGSLYIGEEGTGLLGAVDFQRAKTAFGREELDGLVVAGDIAEPVPTLDPDMTVVEANEALWHADQEQLPVVERGTGRFLGILTRRDLLGAIDREILRRNVLLAKVRWQADEGTVTDFFELPSGQRLEQVVIPRSLAGRTIAAADLRGVHDLNVLAIVRTRPDGGTDRLIPRAADVLETGDTLVVIATADAVERFRALG